MSYIPDCRTDENYNQKYLNEKDAEFIRGFDWCQEYAADNFFDNMDIYMAEMDIEQEDLNILRYLKNHKNVCEKLRECMEHYIEMQRDAMITSMIDNMDDEEYERIKEKVDEKITAEVGESGN